MPAQISWFLEGRVLLVRTEGDLVISDLYRIQDIATRMMQSSHSVVHIINDHSRLTQFPGGIGAARELMTSARPANGGWIVNISTSAAGRLVAMLVAQMFGINVRSFSSIEDALQFLCEVDHTLGALIT